jgi:TRAP-type C4-dicarboxylate transport system substrate-binding protein
MSDNDNSQDIKDLMYSIQNDNTIDASKQFNSLVGDKLSDALNQEKIRISDAVYNGIEDVTGDDLEPGELEVTDVDLSSEEEPGEE